MCVPDAEAIISLVKKSGHAGYWPVEESYLKWVRHIYGESCKGDERASDFNFETEKKGASAVHRDAENEPVTGSDAYTTGVRALLLNKDHISDIREQRDINTEFGGTDAVERRKMYSEVSKFLHTKIIESLKAQEDELQFFERVKHIHIEVKLDKELNGKFDLNC